MAERGRFNWVALLGVLVAVPAALVSIVQLTGDGDEDEPPDTTLPVTSTTVPAPDEERATVTLVYEGDVDGCGLFLDVTIGDQTATPTSNQFTMAGVLVGPQDYRISGTIQCPTLGVCTASGSGVVDVAEDDELVVRWVNDRPGQCDVTLQ